MIQHTYDVQTFDDGNKIIRPALSNEYEALLGCLIDFPDLMVRSVDIVIDGEAEIYNTAGNVFSADIEKEITVITCYLVDDYEPLCVSTEDLKKLLMNGIISGDLKNHIVNYMIFCWQSLRLEIQYAKPIEVVSVIVMKQHLFF